MNGKHSCGDCHEILEVDETYVFARYWSEAKEDMVSNYFHTRCWQSNQPIEPTGENEIICSVCNERIDPKSPSCMVRIRDRVSPSYLAEKYVHLECDDADAFLAYVRKHHPSPNDKKIRPDQTVIKEICGCATDINKCDMEKLHIVKKPWIQAKVDGYPDQGFVCTRCNILLSSKDAEMHECTKNVDAHECKKGGGLEKIYAVLDARHVLCSGGNHAWEIHAHEPPKIKYNCKHCPAFGELWLSAA